MFIPSMYKSVQSVSFVATPATVFPLDVTIPTAIVTRNTRITLQGWASANDTGFIPNGTCRYELLNTTTIRVYNIGEFGSSLSFRGSFLVEEFSSFFLRQAIYYSSGDHVDGQDTITVATGLTLGSKAFVIHNGCQVITSADPQLEADETTSRVSLNVGTGVVTITRIGWFDVSGILRTNFAVVDPR